MARFRLVQLRTGDDVSYRIQRKTWLFFWFNEVTYKDSDNCWYFGFPTKADDAWRTYEHILARERKLKLQTHRYILSDERI